MILKESKSWKKKKKKRNLDTLQKRYLRDTNTKHASKQTCDYDYILDFHNPVGATALKLKYYLFVKTQGLLSK